MAKLYEAIDERMAAFIAAQPVFFVASAPLGAGGHVNLSPKSGGTVTVVDPLRVAYVDATGSGVETIAHLRENGRICLMWCAFEGPPRIVRVHGRGTIRLPGEAAFDELAAALPELPTTRAVIDVAVTRVADSCGYGVPLMQLVGEREQMALWAERKGPEGVVAYRAEHNVASIDGLPGLDL